MKYNLTTCYDEVHNLLNVVIIINAQIIVNKFIVLVVFRSSYPSQGNRLDRRRTNRRDRHFIRAENLQV